jgi:hypothetical protein
MTPWRELLRRGLAHQWAAGMSFFLLLVLVVLEYRTYDLSLQRHRHEQANARMYLEKNNICRNHRVRAKLAGFDNCARSEDIVSKTPRVEALYDLLERYQLCHNGRCEMFYADLAANMPYIVALVLLFCLVLICLWFKYGVDRRTEQLRYHFMLPHAGYHLHEN